MCLTEEQMLALLDLPMEEDSSVTAVDVEEIRMTEEQRKACNPKNFDELTMEEIEKLLTFEDASSIWKINLFYSFCQKYLNG